MRRAGTWSADASWRSADAGKWVHQASHGRRRALAVAGAALLVLVLGLVALVAHAGQQATLPVTAASRFCGALAARDYAAAYRLLSTGAQARTSASQFVAAARLHEAIDGQVVGCRPADGVSGWSSIGTNLSFTLGSRRSDAVPITLTRARIGARTGVLSLVEQSGTWRVDAMATALQGTPVEPLQLLAHFCAALAAADYPTAYSDLSANQKRLEQSEANFAQQVAPRAGARYAGCTPDYATYRVASGTATLRCALSIAVAAPGGTRTVPMQVTAHLVEERGVWKLDGLDLPTS